MMKTKKLPIWSLLIALVVLFTLNNCTKDESISRDGNEDLIAVSAKAIVADIVVSPSGDPTGVIDANVIEAALNSVPAGGTVLLESGSFYVNREMFVPGFNGTLTGRGKDATEIIGVGDDLTPFSFGTFFVFLEPSGDLAVENLSFSLPDGFRTNIGNLFAFMLAILSPDGSNTHFDNLGLTGTEAVPESPTVFVHQPNNGIVIEGNFSNFPTFSSGGLHTLTNSEFSKIAFQATLFQGMKDATIQVSENHYTNLKQTNYRWMDGCNVSITKNTMVTYSFGAIVVTQEGVLVPGNPNSVIISDNEVSTAGFMPVEIGFIPGGAGFDLLIEKNKLTNLGPDPIGFFPNLAGMGIFFGNNDAVVRNNIIQGDAGFGILAETNGSTFIGNNLEGMDPFLADYGIFGSSNTVVGSGTSTVVDGGVDNLITGLTSVEGESVGDRVREAQARRKAILEAYNQNTYNQHN